MQPGFNVSGTIQEMSAAYPDGLYVAQNVGPAVIYYVSYATSDPPDSILWYKCAPLMWFQFDVSSTDVPVWVRCQTGKRSQLAVGPR